MKRLFFITAMFMACIGAIKADEIVVPNVVIPKGGTAILDIQLNNEQELNRSFWFFINLPDGVSVVDKSAKLGERFNGTNVNVKGTPEDDGRYRIMAVNGFSEEDDFPIPGNSGTIVTVELMAGESIDEGTVLDASIENIEINLFSKETEATPSDVPTTANFQITIGAPADSRVTFDENSDNADVLKAATGVDVRVKRTIKAGQWSTICLPFAMTETQTKAAFGDDVQIADFTGCEATYDEATGENIVALKLNFDNVTAMDANHPYIIKVGSDVAEFSVEGVDITPSDELSVDRDEDKYKRNGRWHYEYNSFIGTYEAGTEIPENALFLSGNKFWYSVGKTTTKAFRGYFLFYMVLSDVVTADTRISLWFDDDETTGISNVRGKKDNVRCEVYDLLGRRIENPTKGLYIRNGRKEVVK